MIIIFTDSLVTNRINLNIIFFLLINYSSRARSWPGSPTAPTTVNIKFSSKQCVTWIEWQWHIDMQSYLYTIRALVQIEISDWNFRYMHWYTHRWRFHRENGIGKVDMHHACKIYYNITLYMIRPTPHAKQYIYTYVTYYSISIDTYESVIKEKLKYLQELPSFATSLMKVLQSSEEHNNDENPFPSIRPSSCESVIRVFALRIRLYPSLATISHGESHVPVCTAYICTWF